MTKTDFIINTTWEGHYGEDIHFDGIIEINDDVIDAVDDEWRKQMYNLMTPQDVAEHIAYNMIVNDAKLSQIDGCADMPNEYAKILR